MRIAFIALAAPALTACKEDVVEAAGATEGAIDSPGCVGSADHEDVIIVRLAAIHFS